MKQVLQSLKTGQVELADIPAPVPSRGQILIESRYSLVSLGTEKMLLEFGKAGWIGKAKMQPEKLRQVMQKIRTDGIRPTVQAVQSKLDRPIPLGYCNVGRVAAIGDGVRGFKIGDRVVSNGAHAEMVCVPEHLTVKIPDSVSDTDAAFAFVGAIALQGVRLIEPTLGETVAVLGLGLIGLLGVQLLRANGVKVIGFDYDSRKVQLAKAFGATAYTLGESLDPVGVVAEATGGHGCDAVLITAATSSNEPVRMAPQMCRLRGRVSLVGVCELDLSREDFYKKEIRFQVSCSYGPGRYDVNYEQRGMDYPIGFVRWTEERNVQAVLELMATQNLACARLISEIVDFERAPDIYANELGGDVLGVLFKYRDEAGTTKHASSLSLVPKAHSTPPPNGVSVGLLGAGGFVSSTILPILKTCGVQLHSVCSKNGISAEHMAKKFGFEQVTTSEQTVLHDARVNTVIIATPHYAHAAQTLAALQAGKNVFVEKPLALSDADLDLLEAWFNSSAARKSQLLVGFNRRFSPMTARLKQWLGPEPRGAAFVMTVNALAVDRSHWTQDRAIGGGRLVGEGCHFVDLLRYLADSPIADAKCLFGDTSTRDTFSIQLKFASGSIGVIHYFANGHRALSKERLEVFYQNQVVQLDNFKKLIPYGAKGIGAERLWNQDKGHAQQFRAFFNRVREGGEPLIPPHELIEVARWCLRLDREAGTCTFSS